MNTYLIPKTLQGILWSIDTSHLDLEKDKIYIIHQILSYGIMEHLQWLFKTYPKKEITNVFLNSPYKDYRISRFYFVKNYLLSLKNNSLNEKHYVKNIPRDIR